MTVIASTAPQRTLRQRLTRFLISGAIVQGVYTASMAALLLLAGQPRQTALAISYALALVVHFTLNRQFVFDRAEGYTLHLSAHGARYLVLAAVIYGVTALGLATLPSLLGVAPFVAWLLVSGAIGVSNFVVLGKVVFR
jgi:putative flippase GtrA